MEKGLTVIKPAARYIGKINQPEQPILVIEVEKKKSVFQQFVDGFLSFCDYAATTKAGSGEMDIGLELPSTKPVKKKQRR